ncbi:hypothetical protein BS47DRAFT_1370728 [Hydnum rufescens UP504]|uniref:Cytochrome b5 heme-binding domain-containing protein n=1 Tax=Hydnum rufescens UP504 TaxID=1448309 RepID=A0A9P6B972_9AGAM|nr:hypothetical protein BS47DRAFT_1370728 [Hydnum rufescens UP504]
MSKVYSAEEVAKHNKEGDLWVIIDAKVFDLSKFANLHPGGRTVLLDEDIAGKDATTAFFGLHRHEVLLIPRYARLQIGTLRGSKEQIMAPKPGDLSGVPYGEPTWMTPGFYSPYYKESHRKLQVFMRKFVEEIVMPDAQDREEDGKRPSSYVVEESAKCNLHAMRLGPGKHLKGLTLAGGIVTPEEFDYFHELIITQELCRIGFRGYSDGMQGGMVIGLPPVLNFGRPELKAKIVPEVLSGKKFICLAISEAFAGSDVAGLKCTATKTPDGKHFIVNGTKKWITNGHFSDYFTVACRTDKGLTVFLIERGEGVETKQIKTSYSSAAGTAFITFENVKVPVENMLGPENGGLLVVLSNFNHERWVIAGSSARTQRLIVEECLKWGHQRYVFGKSLLEQPVIRAKLSKMIARVEAIQGWLENITYQMCHMNYNEQSNKLAGQIAFFKMYCTQTAQLTAEDATQVCPRTGMGRVIEHYHRTVPFDALLGGAEDVLGDLGVRQAMRNIPKNTKL